MSNKKGPALLLAALLTCFLFAGCSAKKADADKPVTAWDAAGAKPKHLTQWPDNAFTEKIIPPQNGVIDYVLDYSDAGRYAIYIRDISSKESAEYVKTLKAKGYAEMHAAANHVSAGTILENDDAFLSISYAEGVLGVLITMKK